MQDIIQATNNKWLDILKRLGIADKYLKNTHGPCPMCGGKDRYRFDNKDGKGTYFCNQCGAGNGFNLLMNYFNWTFVETIHEIHSIVGVCRVTEREKQSDPMVRIKKIGRGVKQIIHNDPVHRYLCNRGIQKPYTPFLRHNNSVPYYEEGQYIGNYPCIVAKIVNCEQERISYHLTYLLTNGVKADVKTPKKFLPGLQDLRGSAIQLTKPFEHIGLTEGIENALAVMENEKIPCWAAASSTLMESFEPHPLMKKITIFADNDRNFVGLRAAYILASKLVKKNITVDVRCLGDRGEDCLDYYTQLKGKAHE